MAESKDLSEFPLYNLDVVSLNEVFKNLSLVDVFELSFTTDEVRRAVREASFPIQLMRVVLESDMPYIQLVDSKNIFVWTFGNPPNGSDLQDVGKYEIGKIQYDCKKSSTGYYTQHYDIEHGMIAVLKYLVSIFDCSEAIIKELFTDVGTIEDSRSFFQHFTKFKCVERLAIEQSVDKEANRLNLVQNFEWIMSNIKVDELYIGVELLEHRLIRTPEGEFDIRPVPVRLENVLKINHISLRYADWVTPEDLLSLDVQTIILEENKLTEKDINAFLHQWLNSDSDKLWWIKIKTKRALQPESVSNGLNLQHDNYRQQNIKCSCPYLRCRGEVTCDPFEFPISSKQITRANGTTTATISITQDTFFFHVKNEGPITPQPPPVQAPTQREIMAEIELMEQEARHAQARRDEIREWVNEHGEGRINEVLGGYEERVHEMEEYVNALRRQLHQMPPILPDPR